MKKWIAAAGAVLALAGLGYSALWLYGADRLERAIENWTDEVESEGNSIAHDEIRIGGFPFALTAEIPDLSIGNEADGMSFEAAPIRLRTTLWNPSRVDYEFSGKHVLAANQGPRKFRITFEFETGSGVMLQRPERRFHQLNATNLRIVGEGGILTISGLEATTYATHYPHHPESESAKLTNTMTGVSFSDRSGGRLIEPPLDRLRIEVKATGPLKALVDGSLVEWAEGGGVVTLRDLTLDWAGLTLTATGSGGFDSELRPEGSLTLASTAFEEKLRELEQSGGIAPLLGELIRHWSAPFILPAHDGNPSELIVPLTAKDGLLSVGEEPMGAVPSLKTL